MQGRNRCARQLDRAWRDVSQAIFNAIKKTEKPQNKDDVALAFPDTKNYRKNMDRLIVGGGRLAHILIR